MSEMSDTISLKMGVKFATSLNMGGKLPQKLYIKYLEIHYLVKFHIKYNRFIQNKGILNGNHDYAMLRSK